MHKKSAKICLITPKPEKQPHKVYVVASALSSIYIISSTISMEQKIFSLREAVSSALETAYMHLIVFSIEID